MREFETINDYAAQIGKEIGVSDWVLVDQDRINKFADATGDHQWIHVDVERAKKEMPGGKTIGHGYLTLSLIPMLTHSISRVKKVSRGINYGSNKVRFRLFADQFRFDPQDIAGVDWFEPAQFVQTGGAKSGLTLLGDVVDQHAHDHRAGMPATGREAAEVRFSCRLIRQVERLWIIFGSKFDHFVAGHMVTTKRSF